MSNTEPLLSAKDLARRLGRSSGYIAAMKRRGFRMRDGRTTLAAALAWLESNPAPCAKRCKR